MAQRVNSPYPSTRDPGYAADLHQLGKEILAESDSSLWALLDLSWLQQVVNEDPTTMQAHTCFGLDQTIDLHTWLDLYKPHLVLNRAARRKKQFREMEPVKRRSAISAG
ncbi:hypothetical protein [Nocardia bovistercoris]|uniref:Uncharacterized protein n=1 Tax=Nocardia bovistercoris TaxID=2785916 RepID=A0A931N657_9NOCA|nr:hypothetical protein [Nocardia bovistercoris]MBH0779348.1 hypothetical protein [Nocardia bovistercoris]